MGIKSVENLRRPYLLRHKFVCFLAPFSLKNCNFHLCDGRQYQYKLLQSKDYFLFQNSICFGQKVVLTQFAVGDGGGSYYRPTKEMTALKGEKWRGEINSYKVDDINPDLINVKTVLPASVGGFTIREMGLFDDKGQMIAVANTPDSVKIAPESGAVKEMWLVMEILVSNANIVSIQVNPTVSIATKEDIEKHNSSDTAHQELIIRKIAEATKQRDIVIPVTGWLKEGSTYYIDVIQEDITDKMVPFVSIFPSDMDTARNCGMSTTAETIEKGLRLYAEEIPSKEINASLV